MIHADREYLLSDCGVNSFDFLVNCDFLPDNRSDTTSPELTDIEHFLLQYIAEKDIGDPSTVLTEIDLAFEYLCRIKITDKEALNEYIRYAVEKVSEVPTDLSGNRYNVRDIFQVAFVINGCSHEMNDEGMRFITGHGKRKLMSDLFADGKCSEIAESFNDYDELIWSSLESLISKHCLFAVYPTDSEGWFFIPDSMLLVNHNTLDRTHASKLYAHIYKNEAYKNEEIKNCGGKIADDMPIFEFTGEPLKIPEDSAENYSIVASVRPEDFSKIGDIAYGVFSEYPNVRNLEIRPVISFEDALKQGGISLSTDYPFAEEYFHAEQDLGNPLKMSCELFDFGKSDTHCEDCTDGDDTDVYRMWRSVQTEIYLKLLIGELIRHGKFGNRYLKKLRINDFPDADVRIICEY